MRFGGRPFSLAMIGLLPLLLTSCAYGTRHVILVYSPELRLESDAAAMSPAPRESRQPIVLVPFADRRSNQGVIGEVRGPLGRTADVVATNDVAQWVSQAIRVELERAGYAVTMVENRVPPIGVAILSGEIQSVYCTAILFYEARVSFSARITKDGQEILKQRYRGDGGAGSNWAGTPSSYAHALSQALGEAAGRLVSDLNSLFFTSVR